MSSEVDRTTLPLPQVYAIKLVFRSSHFVLLIFIVHSLEISNLSSNIRWRAFAISQSNFSYLWTIKTFKIY